MTFVNIDAHASIINAYRRKRRGIKPWEGLINFNIQKGLTSKLFFYKLEIL